MEAIDLPRQMGLWVREARVRQGLSQRELARYRQLYDEVAATTAEGEKP